jgi:hypothetical protein
LSSLGTDHDVKVPFFEERLASREDEELKACSVDF